MDETVPLILINTFLAASFGLLTGLSISFILFKKPEPYYIILGPLAGLVAITAGCNSMTSVVSIFVGIIGAVIAIIVNEILNKFEIDDVVGAVPVHLAAGVWGTLAVGFFSDLDILGTDLTRIEQIKAQFIGVISIGFFSFVGSYVILKTLNYFYPLRVSPLQEELGLNIAEHNATSVEHDLISILDKQSQSGDLTIRGPQDPFTAGGVIGLYYNKLMSKLESSESEKEKWRNRISNEIQLAVKVQENFLPKRNLENYPVYGINLAAREVSGDFFSFYPHNDGVYFIIADVAGKGVHAGMVMAKASTLFEIMSRDKVDPDEMIYHMNNDLFLTKTGGMFVTAILGHYNTINDEIESALSAPLAGVSDIMSGAFKVKDILSSTSDMFRSVGGLVGCNQANSNCVGQVKKWKIGSGPSKLMDIKGAFDNITKNANSVSAGGKSFSRPDCSTPSFCGPPVVNIFGGDGIGAIATPIIGAITGGNEIAGGIARATGSLIGINIKEPGSGFTIPPIVSITDKCNKGYGAHARAVIDYDPQSPTYQQVIDIYIVTPGEIYPVIEDENDYTVDHVLVVDSGSGYDENDVITDNQGNVYTSILDNEGRILNVLPPNPELENVKPVTDLPILNIQSSTGSGAVIKAQLAPRPTYQGCLLYTSPSPRDS